MIVRVWRHSRAIADMGPALDELALATNTPVTARRTWQAAWLDAFPEWRPLLVTVHGQDDRLESAAALAERRRGPLRKVVAMGDGLSDYARLPARSEESSRELAAGIRAALERLGGPWWMLIRQLPADDAVSGAIMRTFPHAAMLPGEASPISLFDEDRSVARYASKNLRQQIRKMQRRTERTGLTPTLEHVHDSSKIAAALPEIERLCVLRDHDSGRKSILDSPSSARFFRNVIRAHAERGEVMLSTLALDRELIAYAVFFKDCGYYRLWNSRFDPQWKELRPGRIVIFRGMEEALADPHSRGFDLMRGGQDYKRSMSNHVLEASDLWAWSGSVGAAGQMLLRVRDWLSHSPRARAALDSARRMRHRYS